MRSSTRQLAFCSLALLTLCGCGKKGALIPPEALAPAPIADLRVDQMGKYFQLAWSAPTREDGGGHLKDLSGFILMRHTVLPAGEDCDACSDAYGTVARVDLDYLREARRAGSLFVIADRNLVTGKTYRYKVVSFKSDSMRSKDSNKPERTALAPPPPPALDVSSSGTAVHLSFTSPALKEGSLVGFNVYRRKLDEPSALAPLNGQPIAAGAYDDQLVQHDVRYSYSVRSVVRLGNETVESEPSAEREAQLVAPY